MWLNPSFWSTNCQAEFANMSIKEASAYSDVYWQVYDGTSYHEIKAKATVNFGKYDAFNYLEWQSEVETTVTLKFTSGGSGCPILSVYDGMGYVLEGLLDIHNPDGIDVIASHDLIHTPEPVEHRYLMRLTEHNQTHSHIDQVQLYATVKNGTEIRLPLVSAIHSEDGDVKQELLLSDDVRADTLGADHNNGTSEFIDLEFVAPEGLEIETFTLIIEGHNMIYKIPY